MNYQLLNGIGNQLSTNFTLLNQEKKLPTEHQQSLWLKDHCLITTLITESTQLEVKLHCKEELQFHLEDVMLKLIHQFQEHQRSFQSTLTVTLWLQDTALFMDNVQVPQLESQLETMSDTTVTLMTESLMLLESKEFSSVDFKVSFIFFSNFSFILINLNLLIRLKVLIKYFFL